MWCNYTLNIIEGSDGVLFLSLVRNNVGDALNQRDYKLFVN